MQDVLSRLRWLQRLLAILIAVLSAVAGVDAIDHDGDRVVTPTQTVEVAAPPSVEEKKEIVAEAPPQGELQADPDVLKDETPEAIPDAVLEQAEERVDEIVQEENVAPASDPIPVAGAQGYSCRKDFQTRGVGAFRSRWVQFVWHFTVSANRPGWGDVYAIRDYLASVGLSATFIIDAEGHCLQTAPLNRNPQTQGPFNTSSVSVEIIATGGESRAEWLAMPLIKDGILAALTRDHLLGAGLPLKFVDPVGCTPKAGATDHDALECTNNHWDVGEQFPFDVVLRQLKAGPKQPAKAYLNKAEKKMVAELKAARKAIAKRGGWAKVGKGRRARAVRAREAVQKRVKSIRRAAREKGGWKKATRRPRHKALQAALGKQHRLR